MQQASKVTVITLNPRTVVACSLAGVWLVNTHGHRGYQPGFMGPDLTQPEVPDFLGEILRRVPHAPPAVFAVPQDLQKPAVVCRSFCRKKML